MAKYAYGQQPPDIGADDFGLGWLAGARHLKTLSASGSFWHVHKEIQFLYCIRGEFGYEFETHAPAVLTSGHYIVIPPGVRHRHRQAIDPAGHRIELLVRKNGAKGPYSPFPASVSKSLAAELLGNPCQSIPVSSKIGEMFRALDSLAERGSKRLSDTDLALARSLASMAFLHCARVDRETAPKRRETRVMDEAVAWLSQHAGENISIMRLVDFMGYSRSRLFELFRKHTGLSPADYLSRHRIRMACELLSATEKGIAEIARECGFSSVQYFHASFRKQMGLTPSRWRRKEAH